MALDFTGNDTDRVNHGTLGAYDMDPVTVITWFNLDALALNTSLWAKGNSGSPFQRAECQFRNTLTFRVQWTGGTTLLYVANNNTLATGLQVLAVVIDLAAGAGAKVQAYRATPGTLTTAVSWASTADGATLNSMTSYSFIGGCIASGDDSMNGAISLMVVIPAVLTQAQIDRIVYRPLTALAHAPLLYSQYGYNGTTNAPDYSGNGNTGTITGATLRDHYPLPPPFGFDLDWAGAFTAAAVGTTWPGWVSSRGGWS